MKYVVPPRLKSRYTFLGFHPEELLAILLSFYTGLIQALNKGSGFFLFLSACLTVLCMRAYDGKNVFYYLRLLYRYYGKPQVYTLKECEIIYENKRTHKF